MSENRRGFIKTIGMSSTILLAGCSSDDDEVQDSDGDGVIDSQDYAPNDPDVQSKSDVSQQTSTQNSQDTQGEISEYSSSPEPEVIATAFPQPQVVSTDSTPIGGDKYDFSATIENTGEAGDVIITLQWLNGDGIPTEEVRSIERYYTAGERREETITAEKPDSVSKFGFSLLASSITATVKNSGGSGTVNVEVYNPIADTSMVISSTTIEMGADETQDVEINLEDGTLINDDTKIRAVKAE